LDSEKFGEEIFRLQRFNTNAKKLKESRFMEWFLHNSLRIDFLTTKKSPRESFPPDSHFEEFLSIFLKCFVDKQSSVDAISEIYKNLDIRDDLKERFSDFREGLYKSLDWKPFKEILKLDKEIKGLTLLNIMDVFLYGEFLHDHPKKIEIYQKISQSTLIRDFYWFEFYTTVYKCALVIFHILLLNESVLKDLEEAP